MHDHYCEACNGEGIISVQDPAEKAGVMIHTVCPDCNGLGEERERFDWTSPFWIVLLVPNFLLFWA